MPNTRDLTRNDCKVDPSTHALVIGVGQYPHLLGGAGRQSAHAEQMGQLSSPPISAREFADWLSKEYCFPGKQLASVALLLSEPNQGSDVELANSKNVAKAVREWKNRATANPDNRLIFYFCGHGISQGTDMALLLSDFGADDDNPLHGALDFRKLVGGLKLCAAREQVFFVDACRASTDTMIANPGGYAGAVPLLPGNRPPEYGTMAPVTYYATLSGSQSHARPNEVSLFTGALIKSLRGAGSDNADDDGDWRVNTARLQEALQHFLKEPSFAGRMSTVQVPVAGDLIAYELHYLPGPPWVPVYVGCQEPDENERAEFVCLLNGQEKKRRNPGEGDGEWVVDLPGARYDFVATLTPDDIRTQTLTIRPVSKRLVMEAKP